MPLGPRPDRAVSQEESPGFIHGGGCQSAKHYACWLLGRREWSAKGLEQRLRMKQYSASETVEAIEFCQRHELQSDVRFASMKVHSRARVHGNRRILRELAQDGICVEQAQTAINTVEDEVTRAIYASQRFAGKEMTPQMLNKVWRFLASRGFSGDSIKVAIKSLPRD